jgi:[citrate (pro-3S)-lyase] ligase
LTEQNLTFVNKVREQLASDSPEIPEALKRYNKDLDYARSVMSSYKMRRDSCGVCRIEDKQDPYVNVVNGTRVTHDQPRDYDGTIHLFGHSAIFGVGAEDSGTVASHLQRMINEYAKKENLLPRLVMNCANFSFRSFHDMYPYIDTFTFKKGDMIVIPSFPYHHEIAEEYGFIVCKPQPAFERPHDMGEVFVDQGHMNSDGYRKVAEVLFGTFQENGLLSGDYEYIEASDSAGNGSTEQTDKNAAGLREYKDMLAQMHREVFGRVGALVMNCNPFTLGHRYLVEYAASKTRHLYIFVVEEDKSVFPFEDRIALVRAGTTDLPNVTVLPSGRFIISSLTFADYFDKAEIQDKAIDPSYDVSLFAKEVAPVLGITVRFAGEEPIDLITRQYNDAMRRILPEHGIEFEEIPRREFGDQPISASRVRRLLGEKDFESISKIVPTSTLDYLKKMHAGE